MKYLRGTDDARSLSGGDRPRAAREELVSQLSHAGYLGAELAKAETALRLELHYEQDQPLRPRGA